MGGGASKQEDTSQDKKVKDKDKEKEKGKGKKAAGKTAQQDNESVPRDDPSAKYKQSLQDHTLDELLALCIEKAKEVRVSETKDFTKRDLVLCKEVHRLVCSDEDEQSVRKPAVVSTQKDSDPLSMSSSLRGRTAGTQTELCMVNEKMNAKPASPRGSPLGSPRSPRGTSVFADDVKSMKASSAASSSGGSMLSRTMSLDSFSQDDFDQMEDRVRNQILDSAGGNGAPKIRKPMANHVKRGGPQIKQKRARSFLKAGGSLKPTVDYERRLKLVMHILDICADFNYEHGVGAHERVMTEIAKFYSASRCHLYLFNKGEYISAQCDHQSPVLEALGETESPVFDMEESAARPITDEVVDTPEYAVAYDAHEKNQFTAEYADETPVDGVLAQSPSKSPRPGNLCIPAGDDCGGSAPVSPTSHGPSRARAGFMAHPLSDGSGALLLVDGTLSADDEFIRPLLKGIEVLLKNARLFRRAVFQHQKGSAMMALSDHLASCSMDTNVTAGILEHARRIVNAERASLYIVDDGRKEWNVLLQSHDGSNQELQVPWGDDIITDVFRQQNGVDMAFCCHDAANEDRYDGNIDALTNFTTRNFIALPLVYENKVQGVAVVANKRDESGEKPMAFTSDDSEILESFVVFASVALRNSCYYRQMLREQATTRTVLDCVQKVSGCDIRSIGNITSSVIQGAQQLCGADRCAVFLVDKEQNQLVATLKDGKEIRVLLGAGSIAGDVCLSGKHVNLANAYKDPRFNQEVDRNTGYLTVSLMCYPIFFNNEVIAVAQLINKMDNYGRVLGFNKQDEHLLESFAAFAGITIGNARLFKFAMQSADEAMRLFNLQMKGEIVGHAEGEIKKVAFANDEEVSSHFQKKVDEEKWAVASSWEFNVHEYDRRPGGLVPLMAEVFNRLGFIKRFNISEEKLLRFLVTLKKMYRNVPYHNFIHAFDVMQTLANYLADDGVRGMLTELDVFCTIVIGLLHDVDHMGLNNSFHLKAENPFAFVVSASGSKSVLEVHHCNIAVQILTHELTDILGGLSKEESKQVFRILTNAILATDMARHNEVIQEFADLEGRYDISNLEHRIKLISILTIIADISNVFKPFAVSRIWGAKISAEFAQSGDHEKVKPKDLLLTLEAHTFTQQVGFVKNQIGFMSKMVRPVLVILAKQLPMFQSHLGRLEDNINNWTAMWRTAVLSHTIGCDTERACMYRYYYKLKKYSVICRKAHGEKIMVVDVF
eukprot:TRINITY_DN3388_c0_g1_i1.p1 TRINITY_DN3388_c0_g1~~TRINITY_DN3388_c0_g1_i1.p1  ORF type:complete len:1228 (+),score=435.47 TRINITY_DN3388_c0_g1_i1:100-3783(+)